jgi:hypothetical protein
MQRRPGQGQDKPQDKKHQPCSKAVLHVSKDIGLSSKRQCLFQKGSAQWITLAASALASELGLALFVVRLDSLIRRFRGDSLSKLRLQPPSGTARKTGTSREYRLVPLSPAGKLPAGFLPPRVVA